MRKITPCLWFKSDGEAAARFYVSVFKRSKVGRITRYGEGEPMPKGTVMTVGRASESDSLFDPAIVTFEEDYGAYNQADAGGFIKLNALRMRIAANLARRKKRG